MILRFTMGFALLALAACGGGGGTAVTSSGFAPVGSDGLILTDPGAEQSASGAINFGQSGYAYAVQSNGASVTGRAALINPGAITGRPVTGFGRFDARYQVNEIRDTSASREIAEVEGQIPLTVNFDNGRVRGSGGPLSVTGQMDDRGTGFTGTTSWRGVTGELRGRANAGTIIGAFSGNTATSVHAGGFSGLGNTSR